LTIQSTPCNQIGARRETVTIVILTRVPGFSGMIYTNRTRITIICNWHCFCIDTDEMACGSHLKQSQRD
jgi:hypothetical protein